LIDVKHTCHIERFFKYDKKSNYKLVTSKSEIEKIYKKYKHHPFVTQFGGFFINKKNKDTYGFMGKDPKGWKDLTWIIED